MRWLDGITNSQSLLRLISIRQCCHAIISYPVIPFSSHLQSLPASEDYLKKKKERKKKKQRTNQIFCDSLMAQLVKNPPAMQETPVQLLGQEYLLEKEQAPHSSILVFSCGSAGKESVCNAEDLGLILGLGRSPGEGKDYPLQ